MRPLPQQMRHAVLPDGTRALIVDSIIPDDAPELVREGLARRAIVNGGGTCPCGAVRERPNRAERRKGAVTRLDVVHEDDCAAGNANLVPLVEAWQASQ